VDNKPYSIGKIADRVGLSLHTKKELQDPEKWDHFVKTVQHDISRASDFLGNPLSESSFKFLLTDRINWKLSQDCFPGSINYLATFKDNVYLDLALSLTEQYDLTPFDEKFDVKRFDDEVNDQLDDDQIIIFHTDNHVLEIATVLKHRYKILWDLTEEDIREKIYGEPWFIIKDLLLSKDVNPWKYIDKNYIHIFDKLEKDISEYTEKAETKIIQASNRPGMVVFDLAILYLYDEDESVLLYNKFCKELNIESNTVLFKKFLNDIRNDNIIGYGADPIPNDFSKIFNNICKSLLNTNEVYMDTELSSIGWNICSQIALKFALQKKNKDIPLNFHNSLLVKDLINTIVDLDSTL